MEAARKTAPRWTRRKDARPQELIDAAVEAFVEKGFAATKLDDVAARAGVTKGTLYLYFENKEHLFAEVIKRALVPNLQMAEHMIEDHQGPTEDLIRLLVTRWWDQIGGGPLGGLPKLMIAEASNFPDIAKIFLREVYERGQRLIRAIIQRGIDRGEFRTVDPTAMARVVMTPLLFHAMWKRSMGLHESRLISDRRYLDATVDLLLHGLNAPPKADS